MYVYKVIVSPNISETFFVFFSLDTTLGREFLSEFHGIDSKGICFFSQ